MRMFAVAFFALSSTASAFVPCGHFDTCGGCAATKTWISGDNCRWCPLKGGSCHAELSILNPCTKTRSITDPDQCDSEPRPAIPPPEASPFATKVLGLLFKALKISADPKQCITDVSRVEVKFSDFVANVKAGKYEPDAAEDLSISLSGLATAMTECGGNATVLKTELRALAVASSVVKLTETATEDYKALAKAIQANDIDAVGSALVKMLNDWTTVTNGCASGNKACKVVEGLLKMLSVVVNDVHPCEAAVKPALDVFEASIASFKAKDYTKAVEQFANGLDILAKAISADSCGLKGVADVIASVVPKLKNAVVKVETSGAVSIIVGTANVYDTLYQAAVDLSKGDVEGFGAQMGVLLTELRASGCKTAACDVLEGLLASVQLAAQDYSACSAQLDAAFPDFEAAIKDLSAGRLRDGAKAMGQSIVGFAKGVNACGLKDFASIAEKLADQLNKTGAEVMIGKVVQVLIEGADVTLDLQKLVSDYNAKEWAGVGSDLGVLSKWLSSTGCTSMMCKLVEGVLDGAAIPFQSLKDCADELRSAETTFQAGADAFAHKQYRAAMNYWAAGANLVAKSVDKCHLTDEIKYIEQEAYALGLGHVKLLDEAASILVHGTDFYNELYTTFQAIESKDYRAAGADMGKMLNTLSQWTKGHACTDNFCYIVLGMFEFLGDIQGDIRNCKADFKNAFTNFTEGYHLLRNHTADHASAGKSHDFFFSTAHVKEGLGHIGHGLLDVAKGTADCHLGDLAKVISELAVKLGIAPEVEFVEEALRIMIEAVQIEQEVGTALLDYSDGNWVGFGYNLIKLVKTLLGTLGQAEIVV